MAALFSDGDMRTEESKCWRVEGRLPLELMVAFLGSRRGCNGKGRGTSDRPCAGQVSFSLRNWELGQTLFSKGECNNLCHPQAFLQVDLGTLPLP